MKRNILIVSALAVLMLGSSCLAYTPSVIGGVRDGTALGIVLESGMTERSMVRLGFEADTSSTPGIFFVGGKWFVSDLNNSKYPMYISGGLVSYLGNNTEVGPFVSLIFERFMDVSPLYFEIGVDSVKSGRLQFQLGYNF
jgi:hypothetical protein